MTHWIYRFHVNSTQVKIVLWLKNTLLSYTDTSTSEILWRCTDSHIVNFICTAFLNNQSHYSFHPTTNTRPELTSCRGTDVRCYSCCSPLQAFVFELLHGAEDSIRYIAMNGRISHDTSCLANLGAKNDLRQSETICVCSHGNSESAWRWMSSAPV